MAKIWQKYGGNTVKYGGNTVKIWWKYDKNMVKIQ